MFTHLMNSIIDKLQYLAAKFQKFRNKCILKTIQTEFQQLNPLKYVPFSFEFNFKHSWSFSPHKRILNIIKSPNEILSTLHFKMKFDQNLCNTN